MKCWSTHLWYFLAFIRRLKRLFTIINLKPIVRSACDSRSQNSGQQKGNYKLWLHMKQIVIIIINLFQNKYILESALVYYLLRVSITHNFVTSHYSSQLATPRISTPEQLCNGFDAEAELHAYQTICPILYYTEALYKTCKMCVKLREKLQHCF